MRVGIIALLQESNTFVSEKTTLAKFEEDLLLTGGDVRTELADSHHEVGGFFQTLASHEIEAVPIFAARAYPAGAIDTDSFTIIVNRLLDALCRAGDLDGILVAPHGATVAENYPDADGYWLSEVRRTVGKHVPVIGTIDPHANLSQRMVDATDTLIAYRTNPHLDQKQTGQSAAEIMIKTLRGEMFPTQAASFPSMAINIQAQQTSEPPLSGLYAEADRICSNNEAIISHSIVLGFPYADVAEMGSSIIVVTNRNKKLASEKAESIAKHMWSVRKDLEPEFTSVREAVDRINLSERTLLLDMGDNVGGGSPADGTWICSELEKGGLGPSFVCLTDAESVRIAEATGIGNTVNLQLGGKTDRRHGAPIVAECKVISLHNGLFSESRIRHGGIRHFDQGRTAIVQTKNKMTVMLTSLRMPPFSLEQLHSCGLKPTDFQIIIAKGVIAPLAAYGPECDTVVHVNSTGSTCADMTQLPYENRRVPMFPFE